MSDGHGEVLDGNFEEGFHELEQEQATVREVRLLLYLLTKDDHFTKENRSTGKFTHVQQV